MTAPLALITRPIEDSERMRPLIEAIGFSTMIEPMLTIKRIKTARLPADAIQGYVVTSANGACALAAAGAKTDLPLWAVGERTALAAADLGFAKIRFAKGDVISLASLLQSDVDPEKGPLLHARGVDVVGDLAGMAQRFGLLILSVPLYKAEKTKSLSDPVKKALKDGLIACALFFSPRSAESFVTLAADADLSDACRRMEAVALSEAIVEKLRPLPWPEIHAPKEPRQDALLGLLKDRFGCMMGNAASRSDV